MTNIDAFIVPDDDIFIPVYQTAESCCVDLLANINEPLLICRGQTYLIDCGFSMASPHGWKSCIVIRSGHSKKGLIVVNSPGQIDSDYRGRIKVAITTVGDEIMIQPKERFAQMYIEPVWKFNFIKVEKLDDTKRGNGGYGSTGVN